MEAKTNIKKILFFFGTGIEKWTIYVNDNRVGTQTFNSLYDAIEYAIGKGLLPKDFDRESLNKNIPAEIS
ncbi:MAG: hypothetical protein WC119_00715 [Synergistaceae bacterium]